MNVVTILGILSVCVFACVSGDAYPKWDAKTKFILYQNGKSSQTLTLRNEIRESDLYKNFDPRIPTHMYVHGTFASLSAPTKYCKKLLKMGNFNCIVIGWSIRNEDDVSRRISRIVFKHFSCATRSK